VKYESDLIVIFCNILMIAGGDSETPKKEVGIIIKF
jgi:hypothetical protein